jgi:hypothetical protein
VIAEVCLPKLANIASLWEFLLMKCEQQNTNDANPQGTDIHFKDIHHHFEELRTKV